MKSQAFIERLLSAAGSRRDLIIMVLLVTAISAMILPITPLAADALITANISISIVLLMVAFYVHSPADFSALPSIILITTVFRLSISIAVTRLILIEADGGRIVQTFGDFVISGNVLVGLVIFLIITIVQFLVITKGSERVAEVAARFSLDGLPGKQMSIDADLRNGDIDQAEARRRRQNLEKESQLYGAMDGSMKFVKGDAIAGIVIIAVNLFGGILVGTAQRHLSFSESTHVFSLLTVGEGLIAQIPALFISLTAGTVVTRVNTGANQSLGGDILSQIALRPEALRLAGVVMAGLALVPGFPSAIFAVLAVGLIGTGTLLLRREEESAKVFGKHLQAAVPAEVSSLLPAPLPARLNVLVSPEFARAAQSEDLPQKLKSIAYEVSSDLGFATPSIGYSADRRLSGARYVIELDMAPEVSREVSFERLYLPVSEREKAASAGVSPGGLAGGGELSFVEADATGAWEPGGASAGLLRAPQLLEADVERLLRKNAAQFLGLQETRRLLAAMEFEYKDLLREAQRVAPTQRIAEVLRKLLAEDVPIRNMRLILEAILEWAGREQDNNALAGQVRLALKRQICFRVSHGEKIIPAFIVERQAEEALRKAAGQNQQMPDAEFAANFGEAFRTASADVADGIPANAIVLVSAELRRTVWAMLEKSGLRYPVLSYQEIAPDFTVRPLATIGSPAPNAESYLRQPAA
jgi:type III secretion protein V